MDGGDKAWCTLLDKKKAEIEDPKILIRPQVTAPSLDWGNKYEDIAIANYELIHDVDLERPNFVFHPTFEGVGASPDAYRSKLIYEVKCPYNEEVHAMTVIYGTGTEDYKAQIQCEMWVCEADGAKFLSYDPRYKDPSKQLIEIEVERDEQYLELMEEKCTLFFNYLQSDTRPEGLVGIDQIPMLF